MKFHNCNDSVSCPSVRWVIGSCLTLLFVWSANPVSAQTLPLPQQQNHSASFSAPFSANAFSASNETDSVRINTPRIILNQSNIRINTFSNGILPSSRVVTPLTAPMSEPMKINPLSQIGGEVTDLPPLPLRSSDGSASLIEPTVPIGSYYRSNIDRDVRPQTYENANALDAKWLTPQEFNTASRVTTTDASQIDIVLQQGMVLEKEGRWNEALGLYENAIRAFHKPPVLMQKFRLARFHHDLTKRYNDSSFDMLLRHLSYSDSLALFDEVVSKIQISHVEPPHWNELFENGVHDFEIALADPTFCQRHLSKVDVTRIRSLSQRIVQTTQSWDIRDTRTLRAGVVAVADSCQKEIGLNPTAVVLEFLSGMTNSLDPYTEFMTLNQFNDTSCMITGNFVGLGVELKMDRVSLYINRVIAGSPAEKGGLQSLDRILVVDGTATEGLPLETASNLLQGQAGSLVQLLIQSGANAPREVSIKREHLKVPSVENVHLLDDNGQGYGIGYFRLAGFQRDTVQEIQDALAFLHRKGMKALIIDLRGNAGGVLTESIGAADLFLNDGVIVRTKNCSLNHEYVYSAMKKTFTWDIPLAVLIDKDSASASEIFAGAILDNNRGLVVGQPSFGKDTVQAVIPLTGGKTHDNPIIAGLKLTTETYYSPKGISFYGIGVQPNIPVTSNVPATSNVYRVGRANEETANPDNLQSAPQDDIVLRTAVEELQKRSQPVSLTQSPNYTRYQPSVN